MVNLEVKEEITMIGTVMVDETAVISLNASIDVNNPEQLYYSPSIVDTGLYMKNRNECMTKQAEFEDMVKAKQKEMIANAEMKGEF